jgi:hypothetical protein
VRYSGNVVLLNFWCNLRSVLAHGIIQMPQKRWPCLMAPKIQNYCLQPRICHWWNIAD